MKLKICHLYPDILNLYGDRGNVMCMQKRLMWRNIEAEITQVPYGDNSSLSDFDIFFIGGGQDFELGLLISDLKTGKGDNIKAAVNDGKSFLCICGGYQIMGRSYELRDGTKYDYLGALAVHTVSGKSRNIGNTITDTKDYGAIVGFENHIGMTYLDEGVVPLGKIRLGFGNNGEDGTEGAIYKNVICTYQHGPVLPKNPVLCDAILETALKRKYGRADLAPLDDTFENEAHDSVIKALMDRQK
ncbi:MAG: glutamine amidotransferase [Ruminococcaceae bacterium]|nr:glutamine amidotransferase [Oscillospiraceae bacterium]